MAFALEGIKVIETAMAAAGPLAGRLLGDYGADVIKIENATRVALSRVQNDLISRKLGKSIESDIDYRTQNHHRNKRSITLDLSQECGREIFYRMLEKADVWVSSFRPRELKKFKFEYEALSQLNPRLIWANVNGYGKKGPVADRPAYEHTAFFARSGIAHLLLQPVPGTWPVQTPLTQGDVTAGLALAYGVMLALFARERTGVGQEVDGSLFHTALYSIGLDVGSSLVTGKDRQTIERKDVLNALDNPYQTKDGRWLRLSILHQQTPPQWARFCQALEREDLEHDPRFEFIESRAENHIALFYTLEEVFLSKTLDEWRPRLDESGLPWDPVQTLPEVINDPQARANDLFVSFDHPNYGRIEVVANPVKLSKTPATIRLPGPEVGQHTEEVLLEHGYTWDDIVRFRDEGVI